VHDLQHLTDSDYSLCAFDEGKHVQCSFIRSSASCRWETARAR